MLQLKQSMQVTMHLMQLHQLVKQQSLLKVQLSKLAKMQLQQHKLLEKQQ